MLLFCMKVSSLESWSRFLIASWVTDSESILLLFDLLADGETIEEFFVQDATPVWIALLLRGVSMLWLGLPLFNVSLPL